MLAEYDRVKPLLQGIILYLDIAPCRNALIYLEPKIRSIAIIVCSLLGFARERSCAFIIAEELRLDAEGYPRMQIKRNAKSRVSVLQNV